MDAAPVLDYLARDKIPSSGALGPVSMLKAFAQSVGRKFIKGTPLVAGFALSHHRKSSKCPVQLIVWQSATGHPPPISSYPKSARNHSTSSKNDLTTRTCDDGKLHPSCTHRFA